jgi:uncharacterized protein YbcI
VEKTLIEVGRTAAVHDTRGQFQDAIRHKFIDAVEQLSGRAVLAFISNHHVGPISRSKCSCSTKKRSPDAIAACSPYPSHDWSTPMPDDSRSLHGTHGDVLTAVSEGMAALLTEFYGVGPTQAKTYYSDDLVVCLLRGGFTRWNRRCSTAATGTQ